MKRSDTVISALTHYENEGYRYITRQLNNNLSVCKDRKGCISAYILEYEELDFIKRGDWYDLSDILEKLLGIPDSEEVISDTVYTNNIKYDSSSSVKGTCKEEVVILHSIIDDLKALSYKCKDVYIVKRNNMLYPADSYLSIDKKGWETYMLGNMGYYIPIFHRLHNLHSTHCADCMGIKDLIIYLQDTLNGYLENRL